MTDTRWLVVNLRPLTQWLPSVVCWSGSEGTFSPSPGESCVMCWNVGLRRHWPCYRATDVSWHSLTFSVVYTMMGWVCSFIMEPVEENIWKAVKNERIILKWIFTKLVVRMWSGFRWKWYIDSTNQCQSHVTSDGLSWCQAPIWGPRPGFCYCETVAGLLM
jgi:hypothetical protein